MTCDIGVCAFNVPPHLISLYTNAKHTKK